MLMRFRLALFVAFVLVGGITAACSTDADSTSTSAVTDTLTVTTQADSVAHRLMTAHGADAFASAPYLRFNFAVETPTGARVLARHFWDRTTGQYRVEWASGPDSAYVALINVRNVDDELPEGTAFLNGTKLSGSASTKARRQAYGRFVNDTYWLLAPLKVFDPGVRRAYAADSSTAKHDVLHLTFGDVGLTPNDEYWLYVSTGSNRLDRWAYHLQGMSEETPPRVFDWTNYRTLQAPDGPVHLATRKEVVGADQAIITDAIALPSDAPADVFSSPDPILRPDDRGK